mmetsp:Transcript_12643/g.32481  ORF Transcript_12643/g.32481 Transcript_12643/m.32481 type:complete len:355 (-) Transcript_12643:491-1555(-)
MDLVHLVMGCGNLLRMLVCRVAQQLLHVVEALLHRGVVRVRLPDSIQVLGVLAMGCLDSLELLGMLVCRVPELALKEVQALADARMVGEHLVLLPGELLEALRMGAMLRIARLVLAHEPRVRVLDGLELPRMLVGRVAQELLDVVQALLHGGVVLVQGSLVALEGVVRLVQVIHFRRVLLPRCALVGHPHLQLVYLGVGCLKLLRVLVGRIIQELLDVRNALGKRRVVYILRLDLARKLRVSQFMSLQCFDVLLMLVSRIAKHVLQIVQPLLHRGMVHLPRFPLARDEVLDLAMAGLRLLRVLGMRRLQCLQLFGMLFGVVAQVLLHVGDALLQRGVVGIQSLLVLAVGPVQAV